MTAPQFTERYGIAPSYMCESNAYFRSVATVQARWNRAIFYSGALPSSTVDEAYRRAERASPYELTGA